tara:strand:+ start:144 stop:905 length:762 start_codon:yes stop_codon:yes gene_type:complete
MKQVPNEDAAIRIKPDGSGIIEDNITFNTNEPDNYALEEALLIKEKIGDGEVVICTLGPESSSQTIKDGLAKGADRAIQIVDESSNHLDPLTTAKIFCKAIKEENFDLVLSGLQSDDGGHSQVGIILAELLGTSHASLVVGTDIQGESCKVKRELESGWFQTVVLALPASMTIQSGLNKPRYASLKGIMGVKKKPVDKKNLNELGFENVNSRTKYLKMYQPQKTKETKYIEGDTEEIVQNLLNILKDDLKAIG